MIEVQTPSRIVATPPLNRDILEKDDMDITLTDSTGEKQLDIVASNVNKAIDELNIIYEEIGYPTAETTSKKAEIFTIIQDAILNFKCSLRREKSNIESECLWLRQEIKLLLSIINDPDGNNLSPVSRGIVFNDMALYESGFKQEIQLKLSNLKNKKENFYEDSPFNVTSNSSNMMEEISIEKKYEEMVDHVPHLSLMKLRKELNTIFLDQMKQFIRSFKKINNSALSYLELTETIGIIESSTINYKYMDLLPSKSEAENLKQLIDLFESTVKFLKLNELKTSITSFTEDHNDVRFVLASPKKQILEGTSSDFESNKTNELMNLLRDINYKLVKSIRSLKITRITPQLISDLHKQVSYCEAEVEVRKTKMTSLISDILAIVEELGYNEDQLISLQKQYNERESEKSNDSVNDTYFDLETLNFIQLNATQFGLNDNHIKFMENFLELLTRVRENKEKKRHYYVNTCQTLWSKLGEDQEYVDSFLHLNNNLLDQSISKLKSELNRLLVKRSEFIDQFILSARTEIEELWDKMYFTLDQRAQFKYFEYELDPNDSYDKELILNEHEEELKKLKAEHETRAPIIEDYNELEQLLKDQEFLNESSKDSSRLLSKNSCKILLNEERIRKKVLKNLPRLIQNLKRNITSYNQSQETNFSIYGEDMYKKVLEIENTQINRKKTGGISRRPAAGSVSASSTRPISRQRAVSPRRPLVATSKRASPLKQYSSSGPSPVRSNNPIRKPPARLVRTGQNASNNSRTNRIINAINNSINESVAHSSNSSQTSSQQSPFTIDKKNNSTFLKSFGTQLQPLNSPLIPTLNQDNKASPSLSRMSPLRINGIVTAARDENKENSDGFLKSKAEIIDIQMTPNKTSIDRWDKNTSTPASESRSFGESPNNLGDEYLKWRLGRVRQLNNL